MLLVCDGKATTRRGDMPATKTVPRLLIAATTPVSPPDSRACMIAPGMPMSATIIHLRTNGVEAVAVGGGGTFMYSQHVPSFIRARRNEQAQEDALKIGDMTNVRS